MSGFTVPLHRHQGRALVVGSPSCRAPLLGTLGQHDYQTFEVDDPYEALAELCRRPLAYRCMTLSLQSLYREELGLITTVKGRFAHVEIWLCHTDGRAAALAEAARLGADGLITEEGLHRFAVNEDEGRIGNVRKPAAEVVEQPPAPAARMSEAAPEQSAAADYSPRADQELPGEGALGPRAENDLMDIPVGEPVLTADELRALLADPPSHGANIEEELA